MLEVFMIILGYLLGSIPSAYIAGRLAKGIDIRELGDRNMGAANTFREISPRAGVSVFIADVGKGAAAVLIASWAPVSESAVLLSGVAAVAGHNWPLPLGFRGGRGVSTAIGVLLIVLPQEMAILLAMAAVSLVITRSVTLTCGVLFAPLPFVSWWLGAPVYLITYSIGIPALVGFTHFLTTRHLPEKPEGMVTPANNNNGKQ